ncbi:GDSL family lipase [Catenulispora acidiphila DSM 44928]|uniref:GDSL family lipase n=1 Tax=Catenulispora acidiphila (strain DSM 44928 / JCM 14897 / NBRC 102108 / NRRL B-24433 / ID139908) TaxID=479433 RepID=C7QAZ6_CATAD|nr:SGNH/GDSL hydrolase family protein [Catenulispora acidiphila]ACU74469.1 GDSL family lipase [Catenulispora acidiphila DSM 44928]
MLRTFLAFTSLAAAALVAAPTQAQAGGFHKYVALGDSYTAVGDLLKPADGPLGCFRSTVNFPHDLAASLHVADLVDASCGGAVTADMTGPQSVLGGTNPAQFASLTPDTDLVTVGIGGNDIGFGDIVTTCGELSLTSPLGDPCRQHFTSGGTDQLAARIDALAPTIDAVLAGIHQRAPHATVVVVGYLPVLPASWGCWPSVPVAIGDVPWLHGIQQKLNDMLSSRAAADGALSVNPNGVTGRDACQLPWTRWVEPVIPAQPAAPVHPNPAGQSAVAAMIAGRLGS